MLCACAANTAKSADIAVSGEIAVGQSTESDTGEETVTEMKVTNETEVAEREDEVMHNGLEDYTNIDVSGIDIDSLTDEQMEILLLQVQYCQAMTDADTDTMAKSIGISNFEGKYIEELQTKWEVVPQFIQVEAHPYFTQKELRKTLDKYDIKLMSWYPLGHGDKSLINEPIFAELGKKYSKSPAQIILRWHTQMGFVVIPGSKNIDHIKDNLDILDFKLTDEEMAEIAKLDKDERYYHRTDEQLVGFAAWKPDFEKA